MIRDLLTPEAQRDPHHWAATFGGHFWLLFGPWGLVAILFDTWTAAWFIPLAYFIVIEGIQMRAAARSGRLTIAMRWDSVLDTVAVAFACYTAAALRNDMMITAMVTWAASVIVATVGYMVRDD